MLLVNQNWVLTGNWLVSKNRSERVVRFTPFVHILGGDQIFEKSIPGEKIPGGLLF